MDVTVFAEENSQVLTTTEDKKSLKTKFGKVLQSFEYSTKLRIQNPKP